MAFSSVFGMRLTAVGMAAVASSLVSAQDAGVAMISIEGTPSDQPSPFAWLGGGGTTLHDIVNGIDEAAERRDVDAIVIRLKDSALAPTHTEEIGAAMQRAREAGKPVHVFGESFMATDFLIGSYADDVMVQPGGGVMLNGLYMEEMFLADMFDWIGVEADFVQVGDYKGANEMFMRSEPSPAWDQNIEQLLDGMYGSMRRQLREGRSLDESALDDAMERLWLADADDAVATGLADRTVDLATIDSVLSETYAGGGEVEYITDLADGDASDIDTADPFALFRLLSTTPTQRIDGPTIAVLHVAGTIVDGDSTPPSLFGGGETVGSRTVRNAVEDILAQDDIEGVVVRIDSPGGSATASEIMWQGLDRLSAEKPVWVSIGSMAASGGYYVAVGGDKIYVNPSSIVGSIGVVGGKLSMGELYDKVNLNIKTRSRGPRSDMFASNRGWSEEEAAFVRDRMADTYEQFTSRVSAGREGIDLSKTAEGRLFVGSKALTLGMADAIGGLHTAVTDLAAELDMGDDYDVVHYPGPKSLEDFIDEAFGGLVSAPSTGAASLPMDAATIRAAEQLLGAPFIAAAADGMAMLSNFRNDPVQLVMPRILISR
ncbi:MAG: signal peptide peptidase SppA [Planctomycetota bacterium]